MFNTPTKTSFPFQIDKNLFFANTQINYREKVKKKKTLTKEKLCEENIQKKKLITIHANDEDQWPEKDGIMKTQTILFDIFDYFLHGKELLKYFRVKLLSFRHFFFNNKTTL